ncbi:EamA family transporter [Polaribacter haliotis]|uniref:EamA family transporter n=1 Tax=Polaribacter haliotis TaxID=1888915 RepID=A0A7L8ACP4_9FLAO|nr:DMT family transporter [Polaribacter haliotis]QOD59649.1 EamA family transporter [Polaribacter haliotis]
MQNSHLKNILLLLLATTFISTSGVLGKYINMAPEIIIWFRSIFAGVFLFIYCKFKKVDLKIKQRKDLTPFVISAFLMAIHWITYFYALKLSNVAIGMLSIYTFPVIIAFLEPLFIKTKFNPIHIFLGLLVLTGLYILTPELSLENSDLKGILLGVFSAFCYAIRILILKQHVGNYNGSMLMFYQTLIISIMLLPLLFFGNFSNFQSQLPYLILLALITTAIGHTMLVHSLKHFSASTASIISSIQPISGIIIAYFVLTEIPSKATYIGGSLILATVIIESFRSKK